MSARVRAAFRRQGQACAALGSPFMARLMTLCAERLAPGGDVAGRVLDWPGDPSGSADSLPLRFAGALHGLKRAGDAGLVEVYPPNEADDDRLWAAIGAAMERAASFLLDRLDSPPQTNEVRRSAALIPALHFLAARYPLPFRLIELGCSAGLNLRADLFRLDTGAQVYGPHDAEVRLAPAWSGRSPVAGRLEIVERIGIDRAPLDPLKDGDRLISYLWPDQPDRLALTEAAIRVAAHKPARVVEADAVAWLAQNLAPSPGILTLVFHTIAWQYLTPGARAEGDALMSAAGARATEDAPLARVAMEANGDAAALTLQLWPGAVIIPLGRADYHGRWVSWNGARLPGEPSDAT